MNSSTTATQTIHSFRPTSSFQSGWRPTDSISIHPSLSFYGASPSGVAVYLTIQYLRIWWYWSPTSWHHRNLGVHFGSFRPYDYDGSCESTCSSLRGCFYRLRRIKTIPKFISTSAAVIFVNSFIVFRIDYCNSILTGLQTCQLDRIQSMLNSAARLIYRLWPDTIRSYNRSAAWQSTLVAGSPADRQ